MLTQIFLFGLGVLLPTSTVLAGWDIDDVIKSDFDTWNVMSRCFGEDKFLDYTLTANAAFQACQAEAAPASDNLIGESSDLDRNVRLAAADARKRRQVVDGGRLHPTAEMIAEFEAHGQKLKASQMSKARIIPCVLTKMDIFDAAGNINLEHFTVTMWNIIGPNAAAKDPAFVQKMKNDFTDCYDNAQALPQSTLNRSPITKQWGRQMSFIKCVRNVESQNCYKAHIKTYLETLYGPMDAAKYPEFKGDMYEAATYALVVREDMMSRAEKAIHKIVFRGSAE